MIIKEDYSHLSATDRTAIEQGVATLAVHSFRLDRYVSEEKKAETAKMSMEELDARLNSPEWSIHCEKTRKKLSEQNTKVLEELEKAGLVLGQYHPNPKQNNYDLWFWCNCDKDGRRLDYVTLTVNNELPIEQQEKIAKRAKAVFEKMKTKDNLAIVQYKAVYNEQKLAEIAEQFAQKNLGKFIRNGYQVGKIVRIDPEFNYGYKYAFMRKNAKTHGYRLGASALYALSLENAS